MRPSKILLADAIINLILGVLLAMFPKRVVEVLGVPDTDATFYPSILGAMLIGIGVALVIEYVRKPTGPAGLGLYGAIAINLCGAVFLVGWLFSGKLEIPLRGQAFLWGVAVVLIVISVVELVLGRATSRR
jgi:peptidoglycan/LPS O-acetylase OafA/YrhL